MMQQINAITLRLHTTWLLTVCLFLYIGKSISFKKSIISCRRCHYFSRVHAFNGKIMWSKDFVYTEFLDYFILQNGIKVFVGCYSSASRCHWFPLHEAVACEMTPHKPHEKCSYLVLLNFC